MKINLELIKQVLKLPKRKLNFNEAVVLSFAEITEESKIKALENLKSSYKYFTKLHPKYKLIKNKSLGVALIDLQEFKNSEDYLNSINGKNSAYYYTRKALKRNYSFLEIDKNFYIDDIHSINTSSESRQGRKMDDAYLEKSTNFEKIANYKYFGVLDSNKKLVSYCDIGFYGDFCIVSRLLGHKDFLNDGIMYLMLTSLASLILDNKYTDIKANKKENELLKDINYIMYDTFFGASSGLKLFKTKLGFKPYKVNWKFIKN